jgi:hypothetical protein
MTIFGFLSKDARTGPRSYGKETEMNGFEAGSQGLRRIGGRVVRRHAANGTLESIPGVTVHAEETNGSFLVYSPPQSDWSWLLPVKLRRQEIAIAVTDAQGRFSVGIPRRDIESVASWRQGRVSRCDFSRPRVRDLVRDVGSESQAGPQAIAVRKMEILTRCRKRVGRPLTEEIETLFRDGEALSDQEIETLLETRPAPPTPTALRRFRHGELAAIAGSQGLPLEIGRGARFGRWLGPVWRNTYIYLKPWTLLTDVPDITFRVSGRAGEEMALDSDGFFDVPWTDDPMNDLTLSTSAAACAGVSQLLRPAGARKQKCRFEPRCPGSRLPEPPLRRSALAHTTYVRLPTPTLRTSPHPVA